MAAVPMGLVSSWLRRDRWAGVWQHLEAVGGNNPYITVPVGDQGPDLILDGVAMSYLNGAGLTVQLRHYVSPTVYLQLPDRVLAAAAETWMYTGLDLPMEIHPGEYAFEMVNDMGIADAFRITMWGRWNTVLSGGVTREAAPLPVSLEGYKWPLQRR